MLRWGGASQGFIGWSAASSHGLRAVALVLVLSLGSGCALFRRAADPMRPALVEVEGGTFEMGDWYTGDNTDAIPVHTVAVETFRLGRYEVTYAQYDSFATATDRRLPDDGGYGRGSRPVTDVSWDEAVAFCAYHDLRLPTEVEWEYAARDRGQRRLYAGTNDEEALGDYAYYNANALAYAMPVGMKQPNTLGLYDMSGNVSEWVGPYYEQYPAEGETPLYKDFSRPGFRLTRGGNFHRDAAPARTYWRAGTLNDIRSFAIGFRCAK